MGELFSHVVIIYTYCHESSIFVHMRYSLNGYIYTDSECLSHSICSPHTAAVTIVVHTPDVHIASKYIC